MAQALREFVEKDERDAISTVVKWQLDQAQKHLKKRQNVREENIETEVCKHTEEIRKKEDDNPPPNPTSPSPIPQTIRTNSYSVNKERRGAGLGMARSRIEESPTQTWTA